MKILDPVTGGELTIVSTRGGTEEHYIVTDVEDVIGKLVEYYKWDRMEVIRRLQNSDVDAPVTYFDTAYWAE